MTIYFKTKKASETGKKIQSLIDRAKKAEQEINEFVDELKSDRKYLTIERFILGTGIVGLRFDTPPDMKIWKEFKEFPNYYSPRRSSKEGKILSEKMDSFDRVGRDEISEAIGLNDFFKMPGLRIGNSDHHGIAIDKNWNHVMPEDCFEITASEYDQL